jgi:hypothetical protein
MVKRLFVAFHAAVFAALTALAVGLPTVRASAGVSQTPVATGCAAGFAQLSVVDLESQGYGFAPLVDTNKDGFICGRALPEGFQEQLCDSTCTVPVSYNFVDDNNPAIVHAQAGH